MFRLLITICFLIFTPSVFACDFDADGVDDPTTYVNNDLGSFDWRIRNSSDNSTTLVSDFGSTGGFPIPAYYLGDDDKAYLSYVNPNFSWLIALSVDNIISNLNGFGRPDTVIISGHDFNGDGIDDAAKILNPCTKLQKSCIRKKGEFNFEFNSVTNDVPFKPVNPLEIRFLANRISPLFVMDADGDGSDDLCHTRPLRKKRKNFRVVCQSVAGQKVVAKFQVGKVFELPLSANVNNQDLAVFWKANRRGVTKLRLIDVDGNVTSADIAATGSIVIGDWLGIGSDQVGIAQDDLLTVFNPVNSTVTSIAKPLGNAVDCNNNFYGAAIDTFIHTKNICKVLNCK